MKVAIASLRLSIGQFSHILAFREMLLSLGYEVTLMLHPDYRTFCESEETLEGFKEIKYVKKKDDIILSKPNKHALTFYFDAVLFYNISTIDVPVMRALRRINPHIKTIYTYHEPWYGLKAWSKDVLSSRVKLIVPIKSIGIHWLAINALKEANIIVLPSVKAEEIYRQYDIRYNSNYSIYPLIYRDEAKKMNRSHEGQYFSFIATADKEKNFPLFLKCISEYFKRDDKFKAQIVTKTNIENFWVPELEQYKEKGRLIVKSGRLLSNEEINSALNMSYCTWLFYHHSTQSGVLARSFMMSSPVLASTRGCFERYVNGKNGIIVSEDLDESSTIQEIWNARQMIHKRQIEMAEAARKAFEEYFFYEGFSARFDELLKN